MDWVPKYCWRSSSPGTERTESFFFPICIDNPFLVLPRLFLRIFSNFLRDEGKLCVYKKYPSPTQRPKKLKEEEKISLCIMQRWIYWKYKENIACTPLVWLPNQFPYFIFKAKGYSRKLNIRSSSFLSIIVHFLLLAMVWSIFKNLTFTILHSAREIQKSWIQIYRFRF